MMINAKGIYLAAVAMIAYTAGATAATPTRHATGLVVPTDAQYGVPFLSMTNNNMTGDDLPAKYDLRELGLMTPVRNQGSCGSCWAFAGVAAMESALLKNGKGAMDLAEQEIVSCDGSGQGCSGGWQPFDYMVKKGIGAEASFPYAARDMSCKTTAKVAKAIKWGNIGTAGKRATEAEVKKAVIDFGALWITVGANSNWDGANGTVTRCSNTQTNHAVTVAGYETDAKGKTNFIIKNSWGKTWNGDGYVKTPLGCNNLGETVSFVVPADSRCAPPEFGIGKKVVLNGRTEIAATGLEDAGLMYTWEKVGGEGKRAGIGALQATANENADYIVTTENACGTWTMLTRVVGTEE